MPTLMKRFDEKSFWFKKLLSVALLIILFIIRECLEIFIDFVILPFCSVHIFFQFNPPKIVEHATFSCSTILDYYFLFELWNSLFRFFLCSKSWNSTPRKNLHHTRMVLFLFKYIWVGNTSKYKTFIQYWFPFISYFYFYFWCFFILWLKEYLEDL